MNPRYRRMLIPGLLVGLLVVVVIVSLAREVGAAEVGDGVVSRVDDPRITESSGLAVSREHDDLAYTVNDSGHDFVVYAVRVSTGDVVGVTTVGGGAARDVEALALGPDGKLWVGDVGDNERVRDDAALYALPEPGPGDHAVTARRYPVSYPDGPADVETLLVDPRSGRAYLVVKGLLGGSVLALPEKLATDSANVAEPVGHVGSMVTDGAFTPDGEHAVLRTYVGMLLLRTSDWEEVASAGLPPAPQGETLVVEPDGRTVLAGSEGAGSELVRAAVPSVPEPAPPTTSAQPETATGNVAADDPDVGPGLVPVAVGAAVVAVVGLVAARVLRRRRAR